MAVALVLAADTEENVVVGGLHGCTAPPSEGRAADCRCSHGLLHGCVCLVVCLFVFKRLLFQGSFVFFVFSGMSCTEAQLTSLLSPNHCVVKSVH